MSTESSSAAAATSSSESTSATAEAQPEGFTLWAVLRRDPNRPAPGGAGVTAEFEAALEKVQAGGAVTARGLYDVSGFKADADLMIWLHGPRAEDLQAALRELRATSLLQPLLPSWTTMGVHRPAEFNSRHVPAFLKDVPPTRWLAVYPFVRTHQWYLLPEAERSSMLADHGRRGVTYSGVQTNTVAAFALGDYEWIVAVESDELTELTDMMRALRYSPARRYVHLETPFYTGRRIEPAEVTAVCTGQEGTA
ncbi:MAG TPA: hydrogen peroxide-dependent heme synthase [Ruania sp.]|nr:hydrogen peroxide-dependent heme synthase [Ruania sp.]